MSETTDSLPAAVAAAAVAPAATSSPKENEPSRVSARDLIHIVQGLYLIFWGLLVSVIIGTQIVASLWLRSFAEFFLAGGVLATLAGSWRLMQARLDGLRPVRLSRQWRSRARMIFGLALLLSYFCVLFYMWRRVVDSVYLQANALAFVVVGIVYLIMLSRTVAALAAGLGRNELAMESRLFNVGSVGLLLLPFLGALGYMGVMAVRKQTNLLVEFNLVLSHLNVVTALILLLPLSLTLSVVWAAKDLALQRLAEIDFEA
jgi:hypothetical protein